ncbi:sex-lethal homolog isoform X3 [Trichogramma pretiosum]|uniref:sex-lethal homolog isoform X3 n=1 Tax=Trichogramma pretiosum TaxID=7493 RepID=UPI0006C9E1B8|nr:sex-lethal homolog isoform X3 [Trichogramma pretiosum]XP_014226908.1 sex-lethal homolog isoform X3 [Trichogramma pretiosum]
MVFIDGNSGNLPTHQLLPLNQLESITLFSQTQIKEKRSIQQDSKMNDQQQHYQQPTYQQQQGQQQTQQQPPQQNKNSGDDRTNLIINYLPQSMTEKELYSMFVTIGPVESCRVMKDYKTGYSYGFGFVNYAKAEDAATAINTLNGLQVQNKRLKVSFARPSGEEIKETNLYVTNLPRNITEKQVEEIFNRFGRIVQKNILKDKLTGLPRGVAFVRYDKREEAQEAINHLHGTIPEGGSEPLSVKIAEEHGKQKAAYYAGWQAGFNQSRVALLEKQINIAMLEEQYGDLGIREHILYNGKKSSRKYSRLPASPTKSPFHNFWH